MTEEKLLMLLNRLSKQDVNQLRSILMGQESGQEGVVGDISEIGIDVVRTRVSEDEPEYFENKRTEILEQEGRLARIKELRVWDCGHSQDYPFGGVDSFGHAVCIHCLRWCDRGRHACCVLDSKLLRNGKRVCDYHMGLNRIFRPAFKREIKK